MSNKEDNIYWYGFSWGGIAATCMYHDSNLISKKDAKSKISIMLAVAKKQIKDVTYYEQLIQTMSNSKPCRYLTPN